MRYLAVEVFDVICQFVTPDALFGGCEEDRRQLLPCFKQLLLVGFDIPGETHPAEFVGLCEDDGERHFVFTEPLHELKVDRLRSQAAVNQHKK